MALEPRRIERWLRDAYPTQEVHDRVEWHAEGSMTQCFVRLDDRVVLIHLVGEGDRTVLKGGSKSARSLEAGIHASHTFSTRRHPIPPPYQRGHLQQPRRSSARIRTQPGGALAHRNACRLTQPRTQTQQLSGLRASLTRVAKQLETATWSLQRRSCMKSAPPSNGARLTSAGRSVMITPLRSARAASGPSLAPVLLPRVPVTVRKSCAPRDQPQAAGRG